MQVTDNIRNTVRMVILTGLLLVPAFYAMGTAIDLEYSWLKRAAYLLTVLTLLAIPALLLKARTYFLAEGILNFLFFPIDIASLHLNRQSTSTEPSEWITAGCSVGELRESFYTVPEGCW